MSMDLSRRYLLKNSAALVAASIIKYLEELMPQLAHYVWDRRRSS
jgi:hypothetical protein